jgi:hypothetical protein
MNARDKASNFTRGSTSGEEKTSTSTITNSPTDNYLLNSMSADEQGDDLPMQPSQMGLYANLPPPPPPPRPPQSAVSPQIPDRLPVEQFDDLAGTKRTFRISDIEKQHEKLITAREDLMGCKFRMQMDRKKFREIREEAGAREGSVINQLRTFLHTQAITLPRDIQQTFEQIDTLRDQLGTLEAEYNEAEQSYTLRDIELSAQEMDFIEKLRACHLDRTIVSENAPARQNQSSLEIAPAITDERRMISHRDSDTSLVTSEMALRVMVQSEPDSDAYEVDGLHSTDIHLIAHKDSVNNWLIDTLFQTPLQKVYLGEEGKTGKLGQGSLLDEVPPDWEWVGTFGAQFQSEGSKCSHDKSKEINTSVPRSVPLSRHMSASRRQSILPDEMVLFTKGSLCKQTVVQTTPLRKCRSTSDVLLRTTATLAVPPSLDFPGRLPLREDPQRT